MSAERREGYKPRPTRGAALHTRAAMQREARGAAVAAGRGLPGRKEKHKQTAAARLAANRRSAQASRARKLAQKAQWEMRATQLQGLLTLLRHPRAVSELSAQGERFRRLLIAQSYALSRTDEGGFRAAWPAYHPSVPRKLPSRQKKEDAVFPGGSAAAKAKFEKIQKRLKENIASAHRSRIRRQEQMNQLGAQDCLLGHLEAFLKNPAGHAVESAPVRKLQDILVKAEFKFTSVQMTELLSELSGSVESEVPALPVSPAPSAVSSVGAVSPMALDEPVVPDDAWAVLGETGWTAPGRVSTPLDMSDPDAWPVLGEADWTASRDARMLREPGGDAACVFWTTDTDGRAVPVAAETVFGGDLS